jgi:hypothetical protein
MSRAKSIAMKAALVAGVLAAASVFSFGAGQGRSMGTISRAVSRQGGWSGGGYGNFYPSYGYGFGYYTPFLVPPSTSIAPQSYVPNGWWAGPYANSDPRQAGYNPRAGYRWEDVTTLILGTYPQKAEVTLDGNPIGSAADLGPIQLPPGDHTLRVEAPGYETSETVLKADSSSVRKLQINLHEIVAAAAPSK